MFADDRPHSAVESADQEVTGGPARSAKRRGPARERGTARVVQVTSVQAVSFAPQAGQAQLLSLKLESHNGDGERRSPVAVQLRARIIRGSVSDGDDVVAIGRWSHGTLRARQIRDLTTGATITGHGRRAMWTVTIVTLLLIGTFLVIGVRVFKPAGFVSPLPAPAPAQPTSARPAPATVTSSSPASRPPTGAEPSRPAGDRDPFVAVPDLLSRDGPAVASALAAMGLRATVVRVDSELPAGQVIAMSPRPGTTVPPGRAVQVLVSRGTSWIILPDLTGRTVQKAEELLGDAGWTGKLSFGERPVTDPLGNGVVTDQTPRTGERVRPDTNATLIIGRFPATTPTTTSSVSGG